MRFCENFYGFYDLGIIGKSASRHLYSYQLVRSVDSKKRQVTLLTTLSGVIIGLLLMTSFGWFQRHIANIYISAVIIAKIYVYKTIKKN